MGNLENKPSLQPILWVIFLNTLGLGMTLPVLVVTIFTLGFNGLTFGLILICYAFFQFIAPPLMTKWSDRAGFEKVLLWTEIGTFISWIIFLAAMQISSNFEIIFHIGRDVTLNLPMLLIFLARSLAGLSAGNISLAQSCQREKFQQLADKGQSSPSVIWTNGALLLGPVFGGLLSISPWGTHLAVGVLMSTSLASILITYYKIDGVSNWKKIALTLPKGISFPDSGAATEKRDYFPRSLFRRPDLPYVTLLYFFLFAAMSFFYLGFPILAVQNLKWDALQIGLFFAFLTGIPMVINRAVYPYLVARYSLSSLVIAGSAILAAGFVLFHISENQLIEAGGLLFGIGSGILWPSFHLLICSAAGDHDQYHIRFLSIRIGSLARLFGLAIGAILFQLLSTDLFMIAAKVTILVALFAVRLVSVEHKSPANKKSFH